MRIFFLILLALAAASAPAQQFIGDLQVQRSVRLGTLAAGVISPAQITANQNDYAPTGFASAFAVRLSSDAAREITGLAGGAAGRVVLLANVGSFAITLANADTGSTASARFALPEDYVLEPGSACWLYYDGTSSRWRQPGGGGGGAPAWGEITGTLSAQTDLQAALNAKVDDGAATASGLTMATARLLGRTTASTGAIEEISVGAGLSLSGGSLSSTGIASPGGTPALGDLLYWDGDSWERFARGTDGQVLKSNATTIVWGTDSTGSGSLPGSPATGDLVYYNGSSWVSLAIGTANQQLRVNSGATAPEWFTSPGSGAPTDATYITQTSNGTLTNEQALSSLSTGIMRVATSTGVITSLTDSAGIASNISDETGSGALVFGTNPTISSLAFTSNTITGSSAVTLAAGGSNQNITLTPTGTGRVSTAASAVFNTFNSNARTLISWQEDTGTYYPGIWFGANATTPSFTNYSFLATSNQVFFNAQSGGLIDFRISDVRRMTIASTGNVLIGTTTDDTTNKLQVAGTADVTALLVNNGSQLARLVSGSATLNFGSIAAAGSETLTITVTGAQTGDSVALGLPSSPAAGIVFNAYVSATNTVTVRASNITGTSVDPDSATYRATVFGF